MTDRERIERAMRMITRVAADRQHGRASEGHPSYYQKQTEKEGRSWSGASMGGGVWAGRKEHER